MDAFTLAKACLRRWYVFVPLVVVAAAAAFLQGRGVSAQYSEGASVIVVARPSAARADSGTSASVNPLAGVTTVQTALATRLNSASAVGPVYAKTGGTFVAAAARNGGIINLSAQASSASATSATLSAAISQTSAQLTQLQTDVQAPAATFYRVVLLSTDSGVAVSYPHRSRNIVLVGLAGLLISVIISQVVDATILSRRRRSKDARHAAPGEEWQGRDRPRDTGAARNDLDGDDRDGPWLPGRA